MLNMTKFIKTKTGRALMSILLGFGLATLFRKVCKGKSCVTNYACPVEEMHDKIFKYNKKCYKYTPNNAKCNKKKHIYDFE